MSEFAHHFAALDLKMNFPGYIITRGVKQSQMSVTDDNGKSLVPMTSTRRRHHPYSSSNRSSLSSSTSSVAPRSRYTQGHHCQRHPRRRCCGSLSVLTKVAIWCSEPSDSTLVWFNVVTLCCSDVVSVLNVSVSMRSRDVFWNVSSRS